MKSKYTSMIAAWTTAATITAVGAFSTVQATQADDLALWSSDSTFELFTGSANDLPSFSSFLLKQDVEQQQTQERRIVQLISFSNTVYNRNYRLKIVEQRGRLHSMIYEEVGRQNRESFRFSQIRRGVDIFTGTAGIAIVSLSGRRLNRENGGPANMRVLRHGSFFTRDYRNVGLEIYKDDENEWAVGYNLPSGRRKFNRMVFHGNYNGAAHTPENAVGISSLDFYEGSQRVHRQSLR